MITDENKSEILIYAWGITAGVFLLCIMLNVVNYVSTGEVTRVGVNATLFLVAVGITMVAILKQIPTETDKIGRIAEYAESLGCDFVIQGRDITIRQGDGYQKNKVYLDYERKYNLTIIGDDKLYYKFNKKFKFYV